MDDLFEKTNYQNDQNIFIHILPLQDQVLQYKTDTTFFGVMFDIKLYWEAHINNVSLSHQIIYQSITLTKTGCHGSLEGKMD